MLPTLKSLREDFTSPTKLEVNVCLSCEVSVIMTDGDSLKCVWCGRLQYRSCIKISDDQCCILANFPTNIVYFCTPCFQKLPGALASCDIVDEISLQLMQVSNHLSST